MTDPSHDRDGRAFRERFRADRAAGRKVGLAEYLRLFPDDAERVARAFVAFETAADETSTAGAAVT